MLFDDLVTQLQNEKKITRFEASEFLRDAAQAIMDAERTAHIELLRTRQRAAKQELGATTKTLADLGAVGRPVGTRKPRKQRESKPRKQRQSKPNGAAEVTA